MSTQSLQVSSAMKWSKLQPDLKCFPSSSRAEARDQTGKKEKFAFFLSLERPPHHKLANWASPPIASGQPLAARMPRPQPPHQPHCLREAGRRFTAPCGGGSHHMDAHAHASGGVYPPVPGSPSGRCEQRGQTREPAPPLRPLPPRPDFPSAPACRIGRSLANPV